MAKKKIVVMASGSGTNLQSIINKCKKGRIKADVAAVISDKENAFALERARKAGIPAHFVSPKGKTREEYDRETSRIIERYNPDLIVLAGYMRLLSPWFVRKYKHRIINIHPALLPAFPGTRGYEEAWEYGVKISGCTVHFVDEGVDTGPIILQKPNPVREDDTFESFKRRGLRIEHRALPEAINLFLNGRLKVEGRRVRILPRRRGKKK